MKDFGKHGVLFALIAMVIEWAAFGGELEQMHGRAIDVTLGAWLYLAMMVWTLQAATRR